MDDPTPLYLLALGFSVMLGLVIMLLANATRSLAIVAEVMTKSHAAEIEAFDNRKAEKNAQTPPGRGGVGFEQPYRQRQPESG